MKKDFQSLAQREGLWNHFDQVTVTQYETQPSQSDYEVPKARELRGLGTPLTDSTTIDTAQYQEALKRYWAFMSTKNKAWGVLKLSVSKPIAAKAKNHETPKAFFDWCVSHYSPKNEVILQRLFDQFQKMSLDKASNMEDYLSKLELTQERITAAGGELSDSQLKVKTMNGLSTEFNTFKTTYNIVGKSADTFETLSRFLLNEEYNLGQLKDANTVAHVQSNPSNDEKKRDGSNNKQEKERVRCDVCRLLHAQTECLVKTGKIPADWSENAKKRLQARIDEYVANRRKPFPIITASIDKSESER